MVLIRYVFLFLLLDNLSTYHISTTGFMAHVYSYIGFMILTEFTNCSIDYVGDVDYNIYEYNY